MDTVRVEGSTMLRPVSRWWVLGLFVLLATTGACAQRLPPGPIRPMREPDAQVFVNPEAPWTDAGIDVSSGDRLTIWATGEIWRDSSPTRAIGPDGARFRSFVVGQGGLVGRVGSGDVFHVGARTHPVRLYTRHTSRWVLPPPLVSEQHGRLMLGIRDWMPDVFRGGFTVSVWRNIP